MALGLNPPSLPHIGPRYTETWDETQLAAECWREVIETAGRRWAPSTTKRVDEIAVSFLRYVFVIGIGSWLHHARVRETAVLLWAGFMARSNGFGSLKTQIKRLRAWFKDQPEVQGDPTQTPMMERFMAGLRRTKGGTPKRKRPITPEMLAAMAEVVNNLESTEWTIVFFAILIGFFAFLRKSNLTVESEVVFDTSKIIRRSDIRIDRAAYVLWVRIRRTKSLQYGDREIWIPIHGWPGHSLDIVTWADRALGTYHETQKSGDHAFAGQWDSTGTVQPLRYREFLTRLKALVRDIGLDPENVAGHSLRRGGASYAFHRGVPHEVIKQLGDWQSDCYLIYCVIPPSRMVEASRHMFEGITQGDLGGEIWSASRTQSG